MCTLIFDLSEVFIAGLDGVEKPLALKLRADKQVVLKALGGQPLQDLFCGAMTEDEYLSGIAQREQWDIAPQVIKLIIRENFHHRVSGMEMLLMRLAQRRELVLLSDHAVEWVAYIRDIHPFLDMFNFQFFSFQLKQTKQKPSTFQKVLDTIRRRPEQCLFIDDSIQNIDSAAKIGIAGIRFTGAEALEKELVAREILDPGASR